MTKSSLAPIRTWLAAPMDRDVSEAIERLRHAPDVKQIAVMPDVHLAADVCIGVVVATSHLIYPQAVGSDIGCGMLAVAFNVEAARFEDPSIAGQVLAQIGRAIPTRRRNRRATVAPPADVEAITLSHASIEATRRKEGDRVRDLGQRKSLHRAPSGRGRTTLADGPQRVTRHWPSDSRSPHGGS